MSDVKKSTICSWILEYACHRVWQEMKDLLTVSSSKGWLYVIQTSFVDFIDINAKERWKSLIIICKLCDLLNRGRLAFESSGTPDEVYAAVEALTSATSHFTSFCQDFYENVQERVTSLMEQVEIGIVLGEIRSGETSKARDHISQLLRNGQGEGMLSTVHQEICEGHAISASDISKLMEDYNYKRVLSEFVEIMTPIVDCFPQPVLSRWVDSYVAIAHEEPDVDFVPLSRLFTVFTASQDKHRNWDVSARDQWDRDVLILPCKKRLVDEEVVKEKRLTRKKRKHDRETNTDICDSGEDVGTAGVSMLASNSPKQRKKSRENKSRFHNGINERESRIPGRTDEHKRMRELVEMAERLQERVVDPLDENVDSNDDSSNETRNEEPEKTRNEEPEKTRNLELKTTVVQVADSQGLELTCSGHKTKDGSESGHISKPLKFPRSKRRRRESLELQQANRSRNAGNVSKVKWLQYEEENLKRGVRDWGVGNWAAILDQYEFLSQRTSVSLKDKWRNLVKAGYVNLDDSNDD